MTAKASSGRLTSQRQLQRTTRDCAKSVVKSEGCSSLTIRYSATDSVMASRASVFLPREERYLECFESRYARGGLNFIACSSASGRRNSTASRVASSAWSLQFMLESMSDRRTRDVEKRSPNENGCSWASRLCKTTASFRASRAASRLFKRDWQLERFNRVEAVCASNVAGYLEVSC